MKPLSELSDEDLMALHKQASSVPDLSHLSDDDLVKAYGASKEPVKEKPAFASISSSAPSPSLLDRAKQGVATAADSVQRVGRSIPVLGPLAVKGANALSAGVDAAVGGVGQGASYLDRASDAYDKFSAQDLANEAQFSKAHPNIAAAENLAGSVLAPIPGAGLAGATGVAARIGGAAAMRGADVYARGADVGEAAKAGGITGGIAAGLEAVPYVGKLLGKGSEKLAEPLENASEGLGKFALGPEPQKKVSESIGSYLSQKFGDAVNATKESMPGIGKKVGMAAGGLAGWKMGSIGGHMGGALAASGGAQIGSSIGKKVGEVGASVIERLENAPETLGKFAPILSSAQVRGPTALAAAHYVMSQNDPEYQKLFQGDEAK
jgi:hypothetical protein